MQPGSAAVLIGLLCALVSACGLQASDGPADLGADVRGRGDGSLAFIDGGSVEDVGEGSLDGALDRDAGLMEPDGGSGLGAKLVVVTLNTHSFQEGSDSLEKLELIGQGLATLQADLVGLNEVMSGAFWAYDMGGAVHDGTEIIKGALERASGSPYYAYGEGFAHWADGEEMSNVILSRFPLLETGSRRLTTQDGWPGPDEQRGVIYASVEVPVIGRVNLFVTHTSLVGSSDTPTQIAEVKSFMAERFHSSLSFELLVGDLNTPSTSPLYRTWLEAPPFSLVDTYAAANPSGLEDPTVVGTALRIDYVLLGGGSLPVPEPARIESRRVFDGLELPRVSDHLGVVTTLEY